MLTASVIIFALAALVGIALITQLMRGQTNKPLVFLHGGLAATALGILLYYAWKEAESPTTSIVLFVVAALGGFILFFRDLSGKPGPVALAFIHAGVAVIAFVILLSFVFK